MRNSFKISFHFVGIRVGVAVVDVAHDLLSWNKFHLLLLWLMLKKARPFYKYIKNSFFQFEKKRYNFLELLTKKVVCEIDTWPATECIRTASCFFIRSTVKPPSWLVGPYCPTKWIKYVYSTVPYIDLDNLNLGWWFGFRLKLIFANDPATSKIFTHFKYGQNWPHNNNHLATFRRVESIFISDMLSII